MRRLLYVAYAFPPVSTGSAARNLALAANMPEGGWEMVPLAPVSPVSMPLDPTLEDSLPEGMTVVRVPHHDPLRAAAALRRALFPSAASEADGRPTTPDGAGRLRRWLYSYLLIPDRAITWLPNALFAGLAACGRHGVDLVMSFGPPNSVHLLGLAIARAARLPLVSHYGDLWLYDSYVDWGSLGGFARSVNRLMERMVVRGSDGILTTTPLSSAYFRNAYGKDCPATFEVPNGFDPAELEASALAGAPGRRDGDRGETLSITYTGFFMGAQTPAHLLRGLRLYLDRSPEARIGLRIAGRVDPAHVALMRDLSLLPGHVELLGQLPLAEARRVQARSDVLLICLPPLPGSEVKNPTKLAEYLLSARPILAVAPEGDLTERIERLSAGYSCDPDPESVAAALARVYDDWAAGSLRRASDIEAVGAMFDMSALCRGLGVFLDGVAGPPRAGGA